MRILTPEQLEKKRACNRRYMLRYNHTEAGKATRERCKAWRKGYNKQYYAAHKEYHAAKNKEWREANRQADQARHRRWDQANMPRRRELGRLGYAKNRDKIVATRRAAYAANPAIWRQAARLWAKKHPAATRAQHARRRAARHHATPAWLSRQHWLAIREVYELAIRRTQETGIPHEVDHIYPLQGKTCCGLHVPWNLQVLTAAANIRKSNKMPEISCA